jgi:tetraacyldisaccharide 4'-kinase
MISPTEYRELVSGRRRGGAAAALRGVLRAVEVPYTLAVGWHNRRFDQGHGRVHRVGVPVISVGNLTLGGTGKTPFVKWLAQSLSHAGVRVAIVSRGYGAGGQKLNDEALELGQALPNVPHVQNPDRVAAAERAIVEHNCQIVLLDDGFQHRRLARDLDIVLVDALEPFGYEHVFPRGTLREPLTALRRAHVVCLSRADAVSTTERDLIRRRVMALAPQAVWCECTHAASGLVDAGGGSVPLAQLTGRRAAAFCGIGNPAGFRHTLAATGCEIVAWREFPDHHAFAAADVAQLVAMTNSCDADVIVCTQKDLVKLRRDELAGRPLRAIAIDTQFLVGREELEARVSGVRCPWIDLKPDTRHRTTAAR